MSQSVFVIIEAYVPQGSDLTIESIDQGTYYEMRSDAQRVLTQIAADFDIEMDNSDSFDIPNPLSGFEEHYYYIEELWQG